MKKYKLMLLFRIEWNKLDTWMNIYNEISGIVVTSISYKYYNNILFFLPTCCSTGHVESTGMQDIQQNSVPSSQPLSRAFLHNNCEAEEEEVEDLRRFIFGHRFDEEWMSSVIMKKSPNLMLRIKIISLICFTVTLFIDVKTILATS